MLAGLIAGTLDATAAIILYAKPLNLQHIAGIFKFIASGLFGKEAAFSGGIIYPVAGLLIHYLIALSWAAVYMIIIYPVFKPGYLWIKTILFSSMVWIFMNGIVLPLFGLTSAHSNAWAMLKSFSPILLCVGLTVCFITEKKQRFFRNIPGSK